MATIQAGDRLPEITLPRLDGGDLSFEELRGKRALLFFWGSW
jgi:peroxiredoxin